MGFTEILGIYLGMSFLTIMIFCGIALVGITFLAYIKDSIKKKKKKKKIVKEEIKEEPLKGE